MIYSRLGCGTSGCFDSFPQELEERTASFTNEEFAMFECIMERRGRGAAPAT